MAHWARINENNIVIEVIKINDNEYTDEGYEWITQNLDGNWIKTSINTRGGVHYGTDGQPDNGIPLRKNYAVLGGKYDSALDAFISPQPEPRKNAKGEIYIDFVFNSETYVWDLIEIV